MTIRALISVYDKEGIVPFARELAKRGIEIVSTGGTAKALKEAGINVREIADFTGFPEMMDGRVKTLHPFVHGGILADRAKPEHMRALAEQAAGPIDIVCVNLYPFEKGLEKGLDEAKLIELIDIGGPSMLRSAAKNFASVTVVTDPADYSLVLQELDEKGEVTLATRKELAFKAFDRTAQYDEAIANYFRKALGKPEPLNLHYEKIRKLRYGENPHQSAAFFRNPLNRDPNVTNAELLGGKELSYNNILDTDSALELVKEFEKPTVVFVKHNNPCGVASASSIEEAFRLAHEVDEMSAFGSVVALNRECNEAAVAYAFKKKIFLEVIIAPSFALAALKRLQSKENLRILQTGPLHMDTHRRDVRKVAGGILVQEANLAQATEKDLQVVTIKKPSREEIRDMLFANKVCKHVMSNAIVLAKNEVVTGIGAGQMSRVDSSMIAVRKGGERVAGSVLASDAFFPFEDALEEAIKAGITAVIQPGGSKRDPEIIRLADDAGVSMVFTGIRLFRH